jgi:hypothetical protein
MWGIGRSLVMLVALTGLCVWMALRSQPSGLTGVLLTPTLPPRPLEVIEVIPATALYDTYEPVAETDVFHPQDTFFISVKLSGFQPGMELSARWKYQGRLVTETDLSADDAGEGYAGFSLINDNPPWPAGEYTVEIVSGDAVLGGAAFRVEE